MARKTPTELVDEVGREVVVLRTQFDELKNSLDRANLHEVLTRIAVLEDRVNELKRQKEEGEKRGWQWVFFGIGVAASLASGALLQLLTYALRK